MRERSVAGLRRGRAMGGGGECEPLLGGVRMC